MTTLRILLPLRLAYCPESCIVKMLSIVGGKNTTAFRELVAMPTYHSIKFSFASRELVAMPTYHSIKFSFASRELVAMPTYHSIKFSFASVLGFQQESDVTRNPFRRYVEILFLNGKKAIRQAMHMQRPSEALTAFGVVCGGHTCVEPMAHSGLC